MEQLYCNNDNRSLERIPKKLKWRSTRKIKIDTVLIYNTFKYFKVSNFVSKFGYKLKS